MYFYVFPFIPFEILININKNKLEERNIQNFNGMQ